MKSNIKRILLFTIILFVTIGIVTAANTTDTDTAQKITQTSHQHDTTALTEKQTTEAKTLTKNTNTTHNKQASGSYETTADNYDQLVNKVNDAKTSSYENYTINLKKGRYTVSQTINLDTYGGFETLIINGNQTTLKGQDKTALLNLTTSKNVILNNLTITNFKTDKGCILNTYGELTFNNCQFINNTAHSVISSDWGDLTFNNCQFINNKAKEGGAISTWEGIMDISNTLFANNTAEKGGALNSINTRLNINNSQFTSNTAKYHGGAIYYSNDTYMDESYSEYTSYNPININNSQFINNTATTGNSIYSLRNSLNSRNNNFTGKPSQEIKITEGNLLIINNYFNGEKIAKYNQTILQISINSLPSEPNLGDNITIVGYVEGNDKYIVGETLYITVNNETTTAKTDDTGKYSINYTVKMIGKNNVSVNNENTGNYDFNRVTHEFTVKKPANILLYHKNATSEDKETTISGKLLSNNKGIKGANIIIKFSNEKYTVKTYSSGYFTLSYAIPAGRQYLQATVSYDGNSTYLKAKNYTTVFIKKPTNIILYKVPVATKGKVSKISGKLLSNNKPIKGVNVTLDINGKKYKAKTYSSGYFTINYTVKTFDKVTVKASFEGKYYLKSTNKTTFNVKQKTNINILTKGKVSSGKSVKISGKLLMANNKPLKKQKITVTIGSKKYIAQTYSTGYFTLNHTFDKSKSKVTVKFNFAGSTNYLASCNSTTLTIVKT